MVYAAIIAVGLAAGVGEFIMLRAMVRSMMSGSAGKSFVLVPLKILALAAGLLPALLMDQSLLWLSGCCIIAPLIIGGIVCGVAGRLKGAKTDGQ